MAWDATSASYLRAFSPWMSASKGTGDCMTGVRPRRLAISLAMSTSKPTILPPLSKLKGLYAPELANTNLSVVPAPVAPAVLQPATMAMVVSIVTASTTVQIRFIPSASVCRGFGPSRVIPSGREAAPSMREAAASPLG